MAGVRFSWQTASGTTSVLLLFGILVVMFITVVAQNVLYITPFLIPSGPISW